MELGRDKVLMVLTNVVVFRPDARRGGSRRDQNMSRDPLLQRTSVSDREARATDPIHSLEAGKKCSYKWKNTYIKDLRLKEFENFLETQILQFYP